MSRTKLNNTGTNAEWARASAGTRHYSDRNARKEHEMSGGNPSYTIGLEWDFYENLAVKLSSAAVENFGNPDAKTDYATGVLLHDALGLKAEFDANGQPKTQVRFRILPPKTGSVRSAPASIAELRLQNEQWNSFSHGSVFVLNYAYYDSNTGMINAGWLNTGVRNPESGLEACLAAGNDGTPHLMTVVAERSCEKPNGRLNYFQTRYRLLQNEALEFKGLSDFKRKVRMLMDKYPKWTAAGKESAFHDVNFDGRGCPCIAARMVNLQNRQGNSRLFAYARRIEMLCNHDEDRRASPEVAIHKFLTSQKNASWTEAIRNSVNDDTFCELIPMQRYDTHPQSLPSSSKTDVVDDSRQYQAPILDESGRLILRPTMELATANNFAESIMIANRSGNNPEDRWLVRKNIRTDRCGPISPLAEVQTPNLPEELKSELQYRARKRATCILNCYESCQL